MFTSELRISGATILNWLISLFRNKDPRNSKGESLLAVAASREDVDEMEKLLAKGIDPNTPMTLYPNGRYSDASSMYWAGHLGNVEIAELLLSYGADINRATSSKEGALTVAIIHKKFQMAQFLVSKGADVNQIHDNGAAPIHYAATTEDIRFLRLLLENGAKTSCVANDGSTPLSSAKEARLSKLVALLRRYGAEE